jgi:hypothetical protein
MVKLLAINLIGSELYHRSFVNHKSQPFTQAARCVDILARQRNTRITQLVETNVAKTPQ